MKKTILRLITDGLMAGFLLFSMANRLTENAVHEIIGVLMLAFFILHQALNWRWYQSIFKGKYDTRRTVNAVVNGLLLAAFVVLIGSSVMISKTLFPFLGIEGSLALRQVHTTMATWLLALSGVHLGIHFPWLVRMITNTIPVLRNRRLPRRFKWLMAIIIVITGIHASFDRNLGAKLFMTYAFDFWDFDQSVLGFFIRNLSIIGLFSVMTHSFLALINPRKTNKKVESDTITTTMHWTKRLS